LSGTTHDPHLASSGSRGFLSGSQRSWKTSPPAIALHVAFYNFARVHRTLRTTPAMAAGITDHVWELDELLTVVG
jgi:hypothetical protein